MSIKVRSGRDTFLVAGVPRERGTPVHIESKDFFGLACTKYDDKGKVKQIITPCGNPLVRIHELMHARHTDRNQYKRTYGGVPDGIGQILEDCRLHLTKWPWDRGNTPEAVKQGIVKYTEAEQKMIAEGLAGNPQARGGFADFATRMRMVAVLHGADIVSLRELIEKADFAPGQERLARQVLIKMAGGVKVKYREAARLMKEAFFKEPPPVAFGFGGGTGCNPDPDPKMKMIAVDGYEQPEMDIIELPLTEHVEGASIGERRATMGSRMYRPALRRPILPQRLFVRRTPREPGGTILIDASGSMGDMENIKRWLARAPFGQIAYYAGNGRRGWLWIYAKDGRRAAKAPEPFDRGNTVDGPALTWLLQQPAPRLFVTDRGFCDAQDSVAQIARLAQLEGAGEIVVKNYNDGDDYDDTDD